MIVRRAIPDDRQALHALYREFFAENSPRPYEGIPVETELAEVDEIVESELALLAERDGEPVGFALARRRAGGEGRLTDLYVRPEARRLGAASALVRAVAGALREDGATHLTLWVDSDNPNARAIYRRWGFREDALRLAVELDALEERLAGARTGSFGSLHVQTDDVDAVVRAVRQFVPRLPGRSHGSVVIPPDNGWTAVYDELCDREPALLRRLGRELSDRTGAVVLALAVERGDVVHYDLYERGRVVDEYLSVPEFHGPRPPGEVVSLAANPTLLARLTGADPARIRAVARTARSPSELPPAAELAAELGNALGLSGTGHGFAEAQNREGAITI